MKKLLITLIFFAITCSVTAQKYFTKTGTTEFKASVEAFEPVEAKNESTTVVLNTANGEIAALLFIKGFKFRVALMQEHFNENYMDSDKFPKGTFKGKIEGFSLDALSDADKDFKLTGTLNIRGKDKAIDTTAKLKMVDGKVMLMANFSVKPEDFDIKIPSIVQEKIAKSINVNLDYGLNEKK